MITFIVQKNERTENIQVSEDKTIFELKEAILKQYDLPSDKYIDIEYTIQRPMRVLGKFNVEPGKVPRTMDRYTLEKYAMTPEKPITLTFEVVDGYKQKTFTKKNISRGGGSYRPPIQITSGDSFENSFNLESEVDFPSLC
jgi:hypothetical protein